MIRRLLLVSLVLVPLGLVGPSGCTKTSIGNDVDPDAAQIRGRKQVKVETGVYSDLLIANIDGVLAEKIALGEWQEKGDYTIGSARLFDAWVEPGDHCFVFRWAAHQQSPTGSTSASENPVVEEAFSPSLCFPVEARGVYQVHHLWDRPAPGEQGKRAHFFWVTDDAGNLVAGEKPPTE